MSFAEMRTENWLWMTASQKREKTDKERDKPRMVGSTMGVGRKEEKSRRNTPALKKNSLKKGAIKGQAR